MLKRLEVVCALLVFVALGLAFYFEHPPPADSSLFGAEIALEPVLAPLVIPGGTLGLRGRVSTAAGAPASDAFVVLLRPAGDPSEAEPLHHAYTDTEGYFALERLEPLAYRVVLTHPSAPPKTFALELPVDGAVSWELAPPLPALPVLPDLRRSELAGRLRMPEALSTPGSSALEGFEVVLLPAGDNPPLSGACERRASTDAEGGFGLTELALASYAIEVLPPWARGGSWPVIGRGTCTVREGAETVLELWLEVGALEGELREAVGRPLVGALVKVASIVALDPVGAPQLWPPVVSDAAGRYRVELLPPGRYLVHQRAGAARREFEVVVESGKRTSAPLGLMDPRAGGVPAGG